MVKSWLVQDQTVLGRTATGKESSNPFMAGSLPKTISSMIHISQEVILLKEERTEYILLGMTEEKDFEVCKITKADGTSSFHGDFQALLRRLDRQDLKMMFDPNEEDDIWLNQHHWELLRWKLHEYSGVHSLFLDGTSIQINMLVDKKYPLKKEILKKMINLKIEAEEESNMVSELIKFIKSHIVEQVNHKFRGGLLGIKELLQDMLLKNLVPETKNELYKMMEDFTERMNQELHKQEVLLAAQREQELLAQKQAAQEKQVPSPNSVFRQLIEETCGTKVCEEEKQNMEDTMLDLLKICQQKELYYIRNNVDDLFESALNSKLLSINSQHLDKEKQEVKNTAEPTAKHQTRISPCLKNFKVIHKESIIPLNKMPHISSVNAITPDLSTDEPEYSLIMGNEELSTILEKESDEFIKSSVEDLIPIPRESEDTSGNIRDFL
ncbi:hypothetical protein Tco_0780023 [Tanacetum coccineum]